MKISKIVKQAEEYGRLQGIIAEIKTALDTIKRSEEPPKPKKETFTGFSFNLINTSGVWAGEGINQVEYYNLSLSTNTANLIKGDMKKILMAKLVELEKEQDALEV